MCIFGFSQESLNLSTLWALFLSFKTVVHPFSYSPVDEHCHFQFEAWRYRCIADTNLHEGVCLNPHQ